MQITFSHPYEISIGQVPLHQISSAHKSNKPTLNQHVTCSCSETGNFSSLSLSFLPPSHIGLLPMAHRHLRQRHRRITSPRCVQRLSQCKAIGTTSLLSVLREHPKPGFEVNASRRDSPSAFFRCPCLVHEDVATIMPPFLCWLTSRQQWFWPHDHPHPS